MKYINEKYKITESIMLHDRFGEKIQMNYKGNTSLNTLFGGIFSLILKCCILLLAVYQIQITYLYKEYLISDSFTY